MQVPLSSASYAIVLSEGAPTTSAQVESLPRRPNQKSSSTAASKTSQANIDHSSPRRRKPPISSQEDQRWYFQVARSSGIGLKHAKIWRAAWGGDEGQGQKRDPGVDRGDHHRCPTPTVLRVGVCADAKQIGDGKKTSLGGG